MINYLECPYCGEEIEMTEHVEMGTFDGFELCLNCNKNYQFMGEVTWSAYRDDRKKIND